MPKRPGDAGTSSSNNSTEQKKFLAGKENGIHQGSGDGKCPSPVSKSFDTFVMTGDMIIRTTTSSSKPSQVAWSTDNDQKNVRNDAVPLKTDVASKAETQQLVEQDEPPLNSSPSKRPSRIPKFAGSGTKSPKRTNDSQTTSVSVDKEISTLDDVCDKATGEKSWDKIQVIQVNSCEPIISPVNHVVPHFQAQPLSFGGEGYVMPPILDIPPDDISSDDDIFKGEVNVNLDELPPPPDDFLEEVSKPQQSSSSRMPSAAEAPSILAKQSARSYLESQKYSFDDTRSEPIECDGCCSWQACSSSEEPNEKLPNGRSNIVTSQSAEKIGQLTCTVVNSSPHIGVRTSKSHEYGMEGPTLIDIDFDEDLASSVDALSYEQSTPCLNLIGQEEVSRSMSSSPEKKKSERRLMPSFMGVEEPRVISKLKESPKMRHGANPEQDVDQFKTSNNDNSASLHSSHKSTPVNSANNPDIPNVHLFLVDSSNTDKGEIHLPTQLECKQLQDQSSLSSSIDKILPQSSSHVDIEACINHPNTIETTSHLDQNVNNPIVSSVFKDNPSSPLIVNASISNITIPVLSQPIIMNSLHTIETIIIDKPTDFHAVEISTTAVTLATMPNSIVTTASAACTVVSTTLPSFSLSPSRTDVSPSNQNSPQANSTPEVGNTFCPGSPESLNVADILSMYHQPSKDVDQPSAQRLAKRLYNLDGFRKTDISRHLCKKNDFAQMVGEEFLRFFDFKDDSLDGALRKFLQRICLAGETQDRERILCHFSKRYMECNPKSFNSEDACHTLTCAVMLLNTDLHGQNLSRRMTCNEFVENLSDLNDGENFPKEILKQLYTAIKNSPLEYDVEDEAEEFPAGMPSIPMGEVQQKIVIGSNPFIDVPDPSKATKKKKVPTATLR